MDRETLAQWLAEGRSIESIARETGRAASTVAYWVNKYGSDKLQALLAIEGNQAVATLAPANADPALLKRLLGLT